ncbi:hypothetical protein [Mycolicibacterium fortuitum]|uniref:hypothetical protein n=1 Tax=Mycolicibacterium fortuitum TaxID=1766 RepID=UPI001CE10377|nr:hypothetical protein [Mycolicibacterium fortuitum]MCA4726669.1 hypothetical protein [Mycolicibacterium fortuitum]
MRDTNVSDPASDLPADATSDAGVHATIAAVSGRLDVGELKRINQHVHAVQTVEGGMDLSHHQLPSAPSAASTSMK